ncbi:MAG: hypothetical protein A3G89_03265 [Candidatus Doudnabacteria bacterium RIFCSPLOWO2_12_FULL_42_9]|nr:MAG: hypothetical protein A3G89_03265 [Candidatus Doudnabacteria bacterium RIFCSPLOWO2_12_FULL_42_9]
MYRGTSSLLDARLVVLLEVVELLDAEVVIVGIAADGAITCEGLSATVSPEAMAGEDAFGSLRSTR